MPLRLKLIYHDVRKLVLVVTPQIMIFDPQGTPSTGDQVPFDGLNSTTGVAVK